jgi:hypothetical protein
MSLLIVLVVLAASAAATIHLGRGLRPITIAAALLLAGFCLLLPLGLDPAIVVDRGRLWLCTALFAAPVVAALGAWARWRKADGATPLAKVLLVGAAGSLLTGLCLVRATNMALDTGPTTPHAARVELLESVGGRKGGRTWHVELGSTDVANVQRLRVDEEQYAQFRVGMPVDVLVHDGAFGIRWVAGIAPAAASLQR